MAFMTADELEQVRDSLETWSALCLSRIGEMTGLEESGAQTDAVSDTA